MKKKKVRSLASSSCCPVLLLTNLPCPPLPPAPRSQDTTGLNFTRLRYPQDSRTDCWFCLASPTCEKHLIVSVGELAYVCQPKGPICDSHSLIVPVAHEDRGALCDTAASEVQDLKRKLAEHAKNEGKELFVFERAIQTKGGYHSHVQCIPLLPGAARKLAEVVKHATMKLGVKMRELQNDIAMKTIVDSVDGAEGYFYMEVPSVSGTSTRMLYVQEKGERTNKIPIQFGRELAAVAMSEPEKSHWKACVMDKEGESALALKFRESFEKLV